MWDFSLASEEKAKNLILKKGTTLEKEIVFASKVIKRQNPHLLLEHNFSDFFKSNFSGSLKNYHLNFQGGFI